MPETAEDRVTFWLPPNLKERIDAEYVDWRYESRSEWVRDACTTRMALEDALSVRGVELPDDAEVRAELVETIVTAGVAAAGRDIDSLLAEAEDAQADE